MIPQRWRDAMTVHVFSGVALLVIGSGLLIVAAVASFFAGDETSCVIASVVAVTNAVSMFFSLREAVARERRSAEFRRRVESGAFVAVEQP